MQCTITVALYLSVVKVIASLFILHCILSTIHWWIKMNIGSWSMVLSVPITLTLSDLERRNASSQGCAQYFHWGYYRRGESREEGGFLERGQQPPPHQLGCLGERCELPSGVRGGFPTIFITQDGLSWHYDIVNCGLSCSHWGPGPPCPHPLAYAHARSPIFRRISVVHSHLST